jgi:uncharacterized metal-binding protein YceD (DUF177 family)
MNRTHGMTDPADPWSAPIAVEQIPETGLHRELEASPAARVILAEQGGLRDVLSATASFDVTPKSGGRFHVAGWVKARIGQTCVVSLDPIESDIDEPIDVEFAPPDQIPQLADLVEDDIDDDAEVPDPPEPIENGLIDLGRVATDALFLAIDPYPRKQGVVFEPVVTAPDPEDHPFAALKALKPDSEPPGGKTPRKI